MGDNAASKTPPGEAPSERIQPGRPGVEAGFDPKNLVGQTLDGRYELVRCIGRGGMGVVYLAKQSALDREVVVKVLPPSFAGDQDALARFEREARGMSRLQHPHVVSIYDFGAHDDQAYIVMEYVAGRTLRPLIKAGKTAYLHTFGPIALQILEGISEAHALGMVHRDIKPANIMLTSRRGERNYVKILDFGLAKLVKGSVDVTKEHNVVGSVSYLTPEQIQGNETDQRVDVYALGVLFYYMLSGEKPFEGEDDVAVLYQHVHRHPERLETKLEPDQDIPRSILELIHCALSKNPDNRPDDAGEFLEQMCVCLEGRDISSPHISGEFQAISPSHIQSISPDDPSARLGRERHETPHHKPPPSPSGALEPRPLGGEGSSGQWVTDEHLMKVQKQNRLRNILLGMLGTFVIGGLCIFLYMRQAQVPEAHEVRADIEQAAELIGAGKLGQADNALAMVSKDLEHHPHLKGDYVAARDRLAIARLLADAALHEENGEFESAEAAYRKALGLDAQHSVARKRLRELRAQQRQRKAQKEAPEKPEEDGSSDGSRRAEEDDGGEGMEDGEGIEEGERGSSGSRSARSARGAAGGGRAEKRRDDAKRAAPTAKQRRQPQEPAAPQRPPEEDDTPTKLADDDEASDTPQQDDGMDDLLPTDFDTPEDDGLLLE